MFHRTLAHSLFPISKFARNSRLSTISIQVEMQLRYVLSLAATILQISSGTKTTSKTSKFNGWYPCSDYTFGTGSSDVQSAECATYSAPLCYPGVCEALKWVDQTIDIFVKRLPAAEPKTASNVWLLEGGPGFASNGLESQMVTLYEKLKGAVNVYTMDHRGTGRSSLLDCSAAQAITSGSPNGKSIDPSEVPSCAQALERKYGDLASFSTTSAAKDLVTLLAEFSNGENTIVYGTSYGTLLVERIMHLSPPQVTGYVLDGVTSTTRAPADLFPYFSRMDIDSGKVGDAFMELCARDRTCNAHFKKPHTLGSTLYALLDTFNNKPNSTCAAIMNNLGYEVDPSQSLRMFLNTLLPDSTMRNIIPPLVYRLKRCHSKDVDVLNHFFSTYAQSVGNSDDTDLYYSVLLYNLIVFSELWERPQPSITEMTNRFTEYGISTGMYATVPLYCAFSKDRSKACNQLKVGDYDAPGIIYKHDKYWNVSATIPSQVSVLVMSSKLDAQTPHDYAKYFFKSLKGDNKELVTFEYSIHGALLWTQLDPFDPATETCGMKIFASYVSNEGDLASLDKSCVDEMPGLNMTLHADFQSYFGVDDVYDGILDTSSGSK
ncbi:hypothetical protein PPTG_04407 [Phytophthora nicotianae INRA-310]|uniref:AB hydrolase-1 domain-containing protein n=1 Tax=Phytophthora nicotianae (strain INRA-310) TaxID=761204 RepID=W2R0K6_PHYN3|nr:hypothetical protein PPTG_04407 [Phytophthora nicotianae INRA-310]ETN18972.1 hypothetical protein PPTG_04407 [Phytophthora nicotianae INRA-310]